MDRECFSVICLDSKGVPTNYSVAHLGTLNNTLISNREIFKVAVKSNASSIIVAHNHPSGDVTPSKDDVSHTREIVKAGVILGILVLDHIIVSLNKGVSMRNKNPVPAPIPARVMKIFLYVFLFFQSSLNKLTRL